MVSDKDVRGAIGRGDVIDDRSFAVSHSDGEVFDAVVVGAGFSGLYQLYRLRERGFRVRLLEAGSGPGGVWQDNSYPGARVDSHVPNYELSIEAVWRDWVWTERFPGWEELQRYFRHVVDVLDLARDIRFDTRVVSARFDEERDLWAMTTSASQTVRARFFILCTGFASKPSTGFDANTGGLTAIDIRSVDGRSLADRWSGGVDTYLGMAVAGFPNLLFLYGPQSPTAFCNGPTCAELQGDWIVECLSYLRDHGSTRLDTSDDAASDWSAHLDEVASMTLFSRADSWYMAANIPGKRRQLLNYPMTDAYLERLHSVAENGYEGFVLTARR